MIASLNFTVSLKISVSYKNCQEADSHILSTIDITLKIIFKYTFLYPAHFSY